MKTLKWLWLVLLLVIAFQAYGIFRSYTATDMPAAAPGAMEQLVGMVLLFTLTTVALILGWIGRAVKRRFAAA